MNIKHSLEEIGLSQNEITIYLYLLSKGESLGSQIYKENHLDKSAAYKAIAQLERRSLLISLGDSRNQLYKVSTKDKVIELFENKKRELEESKSGFLSAFSDIEKYSTEHYQSENVKIYSGHEARTQYLKEVLRGEVKMLRTIVSSKTSQRIVGGKDTLDKDNEWFIKERVSKGIDVQVLYDTKAIPDEYDVTNKSLLKECRRYPGNLKLDSMMSLFGDRVGFTTLKNGTYWALILKDQLIVDLLNSMYEAIWKDSVIV